MNLGINFGQFFVEFSIGFSGVFLDHLFKGFYVNSDSIVDDFLVEV